MNATREEKAQQREAAANVAAAPQASGEMGVLGDEDPLTQTHAVAFPTAKGAEVTSCGVCQKEFAAAPDGQVPGLLVCGHSICKSCEEKLIEARLCPCETSLVCIVGSPTLLGSTLLVRRLHGSRIEVCLVAGRIVPRAPSWRVPSAT